MAKANLADFGESFDSDSPSPKYNQKSEQKPAQKTAEPFVPENYTTESSVEDLITSDNVSFEHIRQLAPFLARAERMTEAAQPGYAPKLIGDLSQGFRKAGEYLAIAKYQYSAARNERKRQEAIAFIDEFPKYMKQKQDQGIDVKGTDAFRSHFVAQYPEVLKAKEREAFYEAVQEQLITMKTELFMAISSAKSIAYGYKEANMLSSAGHAPMEDKDKE